MRRVLLTVAAASIVLTGCVGLGPQHFERLRDQSQARRTQDFEECKLNAMVVGRLGTEVSGGMLKQCMVVRGYSRKSCRRCGSE